MEVVERPFRGHAHHGRAARLCRAQVFAYDVNVSVEEMFDEPGTPHNIEHILEWKSTTVSVEKAGIVDAQAPPVFLCLAQRFLGDIDTRQLPDFRGK